MSSRNSHSITLFAVAISTVCVMIASRLVASQDAVSQNEYSVPVQTLVTAPEPEMMTAPDVATPELPQVTPAARNPQYQLHRRDNGGVQDPQSSVVRFFLLTPKRPLLLECSITIDELPFAQKRELQIQKIMQFLADPDTFRKAEAQAAEDAMSNKDKLNAAAAATSDLLQSFQQLTAEVRNEIQSAISDDSPEEPKAKDDSPESSDSNPDDDAAPEAQPTEPVVEAGPKYAQPASIYDRIERQIKSTGKPLTADEVRWILSNWTDGPVLMFLNDNFQRSRANQQPMFQVLDANRDGKIDANEIANSVASLSSCDLNRDEVVEAEEIGKVASDPRNAGNLSGSTRPMIARLDQPTHFNILLSKLAACYSGDASAELLKSFDPDSDGVLSDSERQDIFTRRADVILKISFDTKDTASSRLSLVTASPEVMPELAKAEQSGNAITVTFPDFQIEFSSVQATASDQISIGAVNDGYAMLPELDLNGDERFTVRELRTLTDRLKPFDQNSNGSIELQEILPTYRVCIALGPNAHQPLSVLRTRSTSASETTAAPEWFAEMDKNKDLDLSRKEFPGTDEQFQVLDADQDGLVSVQEANVSE